MRDENNRTRAIIAVLVVIIVLLLGVIAYFLWFQPTYQEFIYSKEVQAYNTAQVQFLNNMLLQLQQNGFIQIPISENQTLYLAAFDPNQVAQQAQSA